MLRILAAVLLIALAACTTPAPPKPAMVALGTGGGDFGYTSRDLSPETIEVTYRGDAVSVSASNPRDDSRTKAEQEKAHDLALWRAAQIAQQRGKAGFRVENENRDSDIEVQHRSYYRPSPFYDPFWGGYGDPFYPRHGFYGDGPFYDDFPYSYQQVRTATARAEIKLTVRLYAEYDPKVDGMLSTADTLQKLQATRSGAVY
jgi:hypothetical protein